MIPFSEDMAKVEEEDSIPRRLQEQDTIQQGLVTDRDGAVRGDRRTHSVGFQAGILSRLLLYDRSDNGSMYEMNEWAD